MELIQVMRVSAMVPFHQRNLSIFLIFSTNNAFFANAGALCDDMLSIYKRYCFERSVDTAAIDTLVAQLVSCGRQVACSFTGFEKIGNSEDDDEADNESLN